MEIKNPYNANKFARTYEINTQPSMTIPDMTMPLKELLDRFARGLPLEGKIQGEAQYHGDDMPPDLKRMDLTEIDELKQQVAEQILQQKRDLEEQMEKQNAKNQLEMFRRWQEQQEKQQVPTIERNQPTIEKKS